MTRVLIAFDKFKDAVNAAAAGEAVAATLRRRHPDWTLDQAPLADGGEGFATILTRAARGREVVVNAADPLGVERAASFGLVRWADVPSAAQKQLAMPATTRDDELIAIVEMAAISGLALLPADARDPWQTTSRGTGELLRAAADAGAAAIVLGVGGSATNDLGLGALAALGLTFHTASGDFVPDPIPVHWPQIARIAGRVSPRLPPIAIACDVTNPLLGPRGAAAVYGPQKGLRVGDHARLEAESERLADLLCRHDGGSPEIKSIPGTGAAGGITFGLMVAAKARLLPGFAFVSAWLDLEAKLAAADLVITGEGRFDESSLEGKGPGAVAARALALGKRVHVFAGQVAAAPRPGLSLHAITPAGMPLADALKNTAVNLAASADRVFAS